MAKARKPAEGDRKGTYRREPWKSRPATPTTPIFIVAKWLRPIKARAARVSSVAYETTDAISEVSPLVREVVAAGISEGENSGQRGAEDSRHARAVAPLMSITRRSLAVSLTPHSHDPMVPPP